jgi:hypothetical protein
VVICGFLAVPWAGTVYIFEHGAALAVSNSALALVFCPRFSASSIYLCLVDSCFQPSGPFMEEGVAGRILVRPAYGQLYDIVWLIAIALGVVAGL